MLRFSLFGFPVTVQWMFWLSVALLSGRITGNTPEEMQALISWVTAAFVSIVIHELGHTFLMRSYGARASIMLYAMGGLAIPDRPFSRGQDIIVSLAGPFLQILVGLAASWLLSISRGDTYFVQLFLGDFAFISIWWAIFNLAPIYPLDGGHVLAGVLGPNRFVAVCWISIITAILIGLYRFNSSHHPYSLIFFGMLAYSNFQRLRGESSSFMRP